MPRPPIMISDDRIARIQARWADIPSDAYEVRIEGDQIIVYGHAARQNPSALADALYSAGEDIRTLLQEAGGGG
jgi:hypothetical protein